MATIRWRGDTPAVAQVTEVSVAGTWATNDTATLTINGKDLTVTLGSSVTVGDVVDALVAAVNGADLVNDESRNTTGDQIPEFAEIEASDGGSTLILTGRTAGIPFALSTSESSASGTLGSPTDTTNATGPNHWNAAGNWESETIPADGDDVVIENSDVDILYGLDQTGITPASIEIRSSYLGNIGLPDVNESGGMNYFEYRDKSLKLCDSADATNTLITIGAGEGNGSSRLRIDTLTGQVTLNVLNTGQSAQTNVPALLWQGTHASNEVNVTRGNVGIAVAGGQSATVATLRVGYRENESSDSTVVCGAGVTLTNIEQTGGILTLQSDASTIDMVGGELIYEEGALGTLNLDGGDVRYRSTGTLITANVGSEGNLDFRQDMRSRTVTNLNLYERFEYHDPFGTVTITNGFDFVRCTPADGTWDIAPNQTLTLSAIGS